MQYKYLLTPPHTQEKKKKRKGIEDEVESYRFGLLSQGQLTEI